MENEASVSWILPKGINLDNYSTATLIIIGFNPYWYINYKTYVLSKSNDIRYDKSISINYAMTIIIENEI